MLIEKKYHTEATREMDEIIREEEERKASLSEEERTAEKEEKYAETRTFTSLARKRSNGSATLRWTPCGWRRPSCWM